MKYYAEVKRGGETRTCEASELEVLQQWVKIQENIGFILIGIENYY